MSTEGDDLEVSLLVGNSKCEDGGTGTPGSLRNFYFMSIMFSICHGCVTSCLSYSSAELGADLGGYGSGTLYIVYAFVALFFSAEIVGVTGPKNGLIIGLWGYCVYVLGFLIALISNSHPFLSWTVFLVSSVIGGFSGGLLWTAQGDYFARESSEYAKQTGLTKAEANAKLAGVFATAYLGMEVLTKCCSTGLFLTLPPKDVTTIVFTVYTVFAVASSFGILYISNLGVEGSFNILNAGMNIAKLTSAKQLLSGDDNRILYLLPIQVSFGLSTSLLIYYVFGTIIYGSDDLGETYVGFLAALIVVVGTAMAIPSSALTNKVGKAPMMILGSVCFSLIGFTLLFATNTQLGTWGCIVPYVILQGVGRGVWENTNKATVADIFGDDSDKVSGAFALISFSNGVATAIGFFTFTTLSRNVMAIICGVFGIIGMLSYCYLIFVVVPNRGAYEQVSDL